MKEKDAIGIRIVYRDLVSAHALRTIFRPDHPKYDRLYAPGSQVELRIIAQPGNQSDSLPPTYTPERFQVKIKSLQRRRLGDLGPADFVGSSPDVQTATGLIYHLGMIYNKPSAEFSADTSVIKIELEYLPKE